MRIIKKGDTIVAVVFDGKEDSGTKPLTMADWALQVISLDHPAGTKLASHAHEPKERVTHLLMESLIVFSGKVKVLVYHQKELLEEVVIGGGQGVMIVDGGIGIEVLEDARMMEFKNGPFIEDKILL